MFRTRSHPGRNGKDDSLCHHQNAPILPSLALALLALALLGNLQSAQASITDARDVFVTLAKTGAQTTASSYVNQQAPSRDSGAEVPRRALRQLVVPVAGEVITALPIVTVAPSVPVTTIAPVTTVTTAAPVPAVASLVPVTTVAGVAKAATISASVATSKGVGEAVISAVGATAIRASPATAVGYAATTTAANPSPPPPEALPGLVITTTYMAGAPIPIITPNVPQKTYWKAPQALAPAASSPLPAQPLLLPPVTSEPSPLPPINSPPPRLIYSPPPKAIAQTPPVVRFAANETVLLAELKLSGAQLAPFGQSQQVGLLKALSSTLSITSRNMAISKVAVQKGGSSSRRSLLQSTTGSFFPSRSSSFAVEQEATLSDSEPMPFSQLGSRVSSAAMNAALRRGLLAAAALDTIKVILELNAGSASKVSLMEANLKKAVASGALKSSLSSHGLPVKNLALSLATAAVPSAEFTQCFQQSSGYCTAAGRVSTHSGLALGAIVAIGLVALAAVVLLTGGVVLMRRRRKSRVCDPICDHDFKILPVATPMTQRPASRWRSPLPGNPPAEADDKPLPVPWTLGGDEAGLGSLQEDLRSRLMLSDRSTAIREGTAYLAPSISPTKAGKNDRVELIAAAQTLQSPSPHLSTAGYNGGVSPSLAQSTPQGVPQAIRWAGVSEIIVDSPYAPQHSVRSRHSTTPKLTGSKTSEESSPTVVQLSPQQWVDSVKGAAARWFANRDA